MSNKNNHSGLKVFLVLLMIVFIAATAFVIKLSLDLPGQAPETQPAASVTLPAPTETTAPPETEAPTETTMPEPEKVIATASICAQGDLLMHKPLFDDRSIIKQTDGSYDFSPIFKYFSETLQNYDYAIANLETTFGGDDFPYQGNPFFNCPDPFVNSVVDAGYDMLLTANNHSYDTEMTGITRTLEVVRDAGLETLGSRLSTDEPRYSIVEVNGIKIGMVCYTYSSGLKGSKPRLNGAAAMEQPNLINWFHNQKPEKMYEEMKEILAAMEEDGAEINMMFIHWGNEYELSANFRQEEQAQTLCDLGVDIIVGGHPHVVQPMELLTSTTNPDHNTICLYSVGNAVSNQRHGNLGDLIHTAHTEDGILFEITFEKYSDGNVYVQSADILPTWVNLHRDNGKNEYNMIPLKIDEKDQWQETFGFNDEAMRKAGASYDRTMKIVGEGLTQIQDFLAQEKADREQYYLDLVNQK